MSIYRYRWWYARPYYALRNAARFHLAGMTEPNPFAPMVKLMRLGVMPLGYGMFDGEVQFAVYVPKAVAKSEPAKLASGAK